MKKKIAIAVWEKIKPLLDQNKAYFFKVYAPDQELRLEDADESSDFYFQFKKDPQSSKYLINTKPSNQFDTRIENNVVDIEGLVDRMTAWIDILKRYDRIDDDFATIYQKEYFNIIKVTEDDADVAPFDDEKQFLLLGYLEAVKEILESATEGATEQKQAQIKQLVAECEDLQEQVPQLTKNRVMSKLAYLWAKMKIAGPKLFKEAAVEFKKEVFKSIAKGGLDAAGEIFGYLT